MSFAPVGIIGGMGPEATLLLQHRILQATPARDDADHLPLMIDMNPQVPSRISHLIDGTGPDPGPTLAGMARRLEAMGASALAMPCNTAHHYADAITAATSIPLINMVNLSAACAASLLGHGQKIGLLASPAVQRTNLYRTALDQHGLQELWPADSARMLAAIRSIKAHGPTPDSRQALQAASHELHSRGAEALVIACSEFSMIADSIDGPQPVVDSLDVLVDAICHHARTSDRKPRP